MTLVDWDDLPRWGLVDKALDLGIPEPVETYSSSDHLFSDLDIPEGTTGRLPNAARTREGLDAEEVEDLGETGGRKSRSGHGDRGGRGDRDRGERGGRERGGRGGDRGGERPAERTRGAGWDGRGVRHHPAPIAPADSGWSVRGWCDAAGRPGLDGQHGRVGR